MAVLNALLSNQPYQRNSSGCPGRWDLVMAL